METKQPYEKVSEFFKQNPECARAMKELKPGVGILLSIANKSKCGLSYKNDQLILEQAPPQNYDVEFILNTESIRRLSEKRNLSLSEIGIEVVKEVLVGHIEIKKHSGIFNFLKNGYINIIRLGGPEFLAFLASHGLGSLQKIVALIRKM